MTEAKRFTENIARRTCNMDGCEGKHLAKGYCNKHYNRLVRHGSPHFNSYDKPILERLEDAYIPVPESGCWLWERTLSQGYGSISINGKTHNAHRVSWEAHNGPIPEGKLVLHKCDTRCCINPKHLYVGTHSDNMNDAIDRERRTH